MTLVLPRLETAIWPVTMADADWVIQLAEECYERPLDHQGCRDWIADALTAGPNVFFCRGNDSVGVAMAQNAFYDPHQLQVHMLYLMARPNRYMAGYRMLLAMASWARHIGATSFHFGSTTKMDLAPFAKRLAKYGAVPDQPTWTIPFDSTR